MLGMMLFRQFIINGRSRTPEIDTIATKDNLSSIGVDALPTNNLIIGTMYRLTGMDHIAKAPPGWYRRITNGWICINYEDCYNLGDLSGVISLNLISGIVYNINIVGEVTELNFNIGPGTTLMRITNSDGYACVPPTGFEYGNWVVADVPISTVVFTVAGNCKLVNSGEIV